MKQVASCHFFITLVLLLGLSLELFAVKALAAPQVRITSVDTLTFGTWSGSGDMFQTDGVCIYNDTSTNYRITATATEGSFIMTSGGNNLGYVVTFQGSSGGFVGLDYNTPTGFTAANMASETCGGSTNGNLRVTFTDASLSAAKSGSYSGSLILLLEPN
jgi:hypothetical protein